MKAFVPRHGPDTSKSRDDSVHPRRFFTLILDEKGFSNVKASNPFGHASDGRPVANRMSLRQLPQISCFGGEFRSAVPERHLPTGWKLPTRHATEVKPIRLDSIFTS